MLPQIPALEPTKLEQVAIVQKLEAKEVKKEETKKVLYIIKRGDNLTKIAEANRTSVSRLWAANTDLTNPDHIEPDKPLNIPQDGEILADRPFPTPQPSQPAHSTVSRQPQATRGSSTANKPQPATQRRSVVPGNTYTWGYCTWHVKNMRPDLPNNLGNADSWYSRAQAQGIPTGTAPRVGAAGMTKAYMHVVYITAVNSNGTVTVSEMNYSGTPGGGFGRVSSRVAPASEFYYIY